MAKCTNCKTNNEYQTRDFLCWSCSQGWVSKKRLPPPPPKVLCEVKMDVAGCKREEAVDLWRNSAGKTLKLCKRCSDYSKSSYKDGHTPQKAGWTIEAL